MKKLLSWIMLLLYAGITLSLCACGAGVSVEQTENGYTASESQEIAEPTPEPEATPEPEPTPEPTPEPLPFAEEYGWRFSDPLEVTVPVAQKGTADYIEFYPVEITLGAPAITRSEPDEDGYVTYTVTYESPFSMEFYYEGDNATDLGSRSRDFEVFDFYTGAHIENDLTLELDEGQRYDEAMLVTQIEYEGKTYEVFYKSELAADDPVQDIVPEGAGYYCNFHGPAVYTMTIRAPQDYDGLVIGLDHVTQPDILAEGESEPEVVFWDDFDNVDNWIFVRLDDYAAAASDAM